MLVKTLFKSFNNKITTTEKKETKNTNTKRKKKIGNISDIIVIINGNKKIRRQELKLNVYVLPYMVVTLDTAHFERSLLNADAL